MKNKILLCAAFIVFCFAGIAPLGAIEITQGYIRLVLHEASGRFTLYGMAGEEQWLPLFSSQDPRTSFLAVNIDDRIFRMGEASSFRCRVEEDGDDSVSYYFESATLQVRQEFSFVRIGDYQNINGVSITFNLKNIHSQQHFVGMRFLLDTSLGEGGKRTPFYVNKQSITDEAIVSGENVQYWVSRGDQVALMGSVEAQYGPSPDYLHIANWKRLNEVTWKAMQTKGRNFNYPPYSIGDSAVCYYYEPKPLAPDSEFTYTIILALEDDAGFDYAQVQPNFPAVPAGKPTQPNLTDPLAQKRDEANKAWETDIALLQSNIARLNLYLDGSIEITEEELAAMELTINMLKARYGLP